MMEVKLSWDNFKQFIINEKKEHYNHVDPEDKDYTLIFSYVDGITFYSLLEEGSTGYTEFSNVHHSESNLNEAPRVRITTNRTGKAR